MKLYLFLEDCNHSPVCADSIVEAIAYYTPPGYRLRTQIWVNPYWLLIFASEHISYTTLVYEYVLERGVLVTK